MLVFYGHGEEFRPIAHAGIEQCPVCNQFFNFHIYEDSAYFTLYFVPVARWNQKYFLVCHGCRQRFTLQPHEHERLLQWSVNVPPHEICVEIWNRLYTTLASVQSLHPTAEQNATTSFHAVRNTVDLLRQNYRHEHVTYVMERFVHLMTDHPRPWFSEDIWKTPEPPRRQVEVRVVPTPPKAVAPVVTHEIPKQPQVRATEQKTRKEPTPTIQTAGASFIFGVAILLGTVFLMLTMIAVTRLLPTDKSQQETQSVETNTATPSINTRLAAQLVVIPIDGVWTTSNGSRIRLTNSDDGVRLRVLRTGAEGHLTRVGNSLSGKINGSYDPGGNHTRASLFDGTIESANSIILRERFLDKQSRNKVDAQIVLTRAE